MASNTMATWNKRTQKKRNNGRKRKNKESRHSTLSAVELFAGLGEPGQPAPPKSAPAAKKAAPVKKAAKKPAATPAA
ncbi:MAG: hypothetical protein JWN44_4132 [Myxococcales bacterium]|nr:hypothetical protein [Myxococcales bacterium]